jgi:two-component system sensor kinase FixL
MQIVRKDGSIGICEATIRTLQDSENKLIAYVCAIRDITDRKRTEEALRQSEERYRQLVENAPDAIYVNHDWKIVYANSAAAQLLGAHSPQDLLGRDVLPLFDPAYWEVIRARSKSMFAEWSAAPLLEERIVRLDGSRVDVEVVAAPCVYNGAPSSQVMLRDISRRKRAEEAVREKQAELAHVMRLNTMGNMVSQLAHEINQPLYAINNYASACRQLLQDRKRDCPFELREWVQKISEQATRAGEIIRRLSHFVRKTPPARSSALLHAVIQRVVELVEIDARLDRVRIRLDLTEGAQRVVIDRVQIEQVVVNLVVNAIEAMETTAVELREVVLSCVSHQGQVEVAVRDAGAGVSTEQMDRLFEPFFTTKDSGMGMGLSISRSIIEAHGGQLWATKNADRGMTFRFTLPLSDASSATANT